MLQPDTKDDVFELCCSVQMDPTAYKHFELPVMAISAPPAAVEDAPPGLPPAAAPVPCEPAPCEVRTAQSIGSDLSALVTVHKQMAHQPLIMPIVSGVGGSGATTILAGLGRALSIIGERVLLVDAGGPSTLDCFYEAHAEHSGLLLSTESRSPFEGQVHVLRTHAEATGGVQSCSTRFYRAAAELRTRLDHILVGGAETLPPALMNQVWARGVCLVIVTPELRSSLAVPTVLRTLADRSPQMGIRVKPWFVLNRFDESIPAHVELRARLAAQLGPSLLPFCIPESEIVDESLAQGINALDLAPQSAFAEACFNLAEWYRATSAKFNPMSSQIEETQLVPE
jgi:cellulose biosynthesis protein BcsQ